MLKKTLFLIFIFIKGAFAVVPGQLGEKNFKEFAPINHLFFDKEQYQGKLIFRDTVLDERYIDHLFQGQIGDLGMFLNWELYNASQCPNETLSENLELFRFLYRALSISYLYEEINQMKWESKKLNLGKTCEVNFKALLSSCKAKSNDMKVFLSNAELFLGKNENVLSASHDYQIYLNDWIRDYKNPKVYSFSKKRIQSYCENKNCHLSSRASIEKTFRESCEEDTKLLKNICDEEDHIYGLSSITEANYILARSEFVQKLDNKEIIQGCLRRFSEVMKESETGAKKLEGIYVNVFQKLQNDNDALGSLSGEIFKAANLKIFADKGLKTVLKKEEKPKKEVAIVVPIKKETLPKKEKIKASPVIKKVEPEKIAEKPKPEPKKAPQYSAFLTAINFMTSYELPSVKVDMLKLRYDYIFSPQVLDALEKTIDKYMAREALKQMKSFDKLGTKKGPVPLMFVKYMIEQEKHTGLYNLINTLGNKFYVENDIDGKEFNKPQYIEIKNDESTKNIWQIFVLNDSL